MQRVHGLLAVLEVADVKIGQAVVHKAKHGAVVTVGVLVNQPGDEVRRKGNDKGLAGQDEDKHTDMMKPTQMNLREQWILNTVYKCISRWLIR